MGNSTRKDKLRSKFKTELEARPTNLETNYHEVFEKINDMEIGEELQSDQWVIVRVPNGWMVWRINIGSIFVPETA